MYRFIMDPYWPISNRHLLGVASHHLLSLRCKKKTGIPGRFGGGAAWAVKTVQEKPLPSVSTASIMIPLSEKNRQPCCNCCFLTNILLKKTGIHHLNGDHPVKMLQKSCNKTLWKKGGFSHQLAKYLPSQVPLHLRSPKQQSPRAHLWGHVALLPWTSLLHVEKKNNLKVAPGRSWMLQKSQGPTHRLGCF